MAELDEDATGDSHWLNWCRLCAKDDLRGNVKIYTNENENSWNSVLVMAIRKYFDVQMSLDDELGSVLCKECYTLISELIDFAEHVTKVQAIFEVLRQSEPNKHLDMEALRQQYGLREGNWSHIIKPMPDMENGAAKEDSNAAMPEQMLQEEFIVLGEQPKPLEHDESVIHLPIEEILVAGRDATNHTTDNPIRRKSKRLSKSDTKDNKKRLLQCKEEPVEDQTGLQINEPVLPKQAEDIVDNSTSPVAGLELLPEAAGPATLNVEPEVPLDYSSSLDGNENELETNMLDMPSKRRALECKWCGKVYHNPASYQKHVRIVCRKVKRRTKVDKNTFCEQCNKTLSSAAALRLHKEGMHENAKRYICDLCGKQLKTITALNEHKLVHTEDRPFSCTICSAGFKNRARLNVHYQIHDEPRFVCNICGKKLQTRRTWNSHKLVHSEERRFKCDACGALFKRSKTLKKHLISHSGLRPYVCKYCGQSFACNANRRTHKQKKHPQEMNNDEGEGEAEAVLTDISVPTLEELRVMSQKIYQVKEETAN